MSAPYEQSSAAAATAARHVVGLLSEPTCLVDAAGRVVAASEAAASQLGREREKVVGRPLAELLDDDPAEVERVLDVWRGSSGWRPGALHVRGRRPDDPGVHCRGARVPGTDLVLVSVSERERAVADFVALSREVELSNLRRMESRLQESLAELEAVNQRLEMANAELERYASMVAHDIRTPLNAIGRFVDLIEADHGDDLPDDLAEMLGAIARLAGRGEDVAVALLSLARTGEAEPVSEGSDSNAVVARVVRDLEDAIAEADAELSVGELPPTVVQPVHLERVISNLLTNALHYATGERAPVVVVEAERLGDEVRFTVSDNGPGIPEEERERIFEPLVRGSAGARRPGTGIGLATCRKIVEAYGGTIEVVGSDGPGATIAFTLPAVAPPEDRSTG